MTIHTPQNNRRPKSNQAVGEMGREDLPIDGEGYFDEGFGEGGASRDPDNFPEYFPESFSQGDVSPEEDSFGGHPQE